MFANSDLFYILTADLKKFLTNFCSCIRYRWSQVTDKELIDILEFQVQEVQYHLNSTFLNTFKNGSVY